MCVCGGEAGEAEGQRKGGELGLREGWGPLPTRPSPGVLRTYLMAALRPQLPALPSCCAGPTGERPRARGQPPDRFARPVPAPSPERPPCQLAPRSGGCPRAWYPR